MFFCPNCGSQIPDGENFCRNCGTPLNAYQSAPQPQPQPQPKRNKGLIIAIIVVAALCVITVAVWLITSHLGSSQNTPAATPSVPAFSLNTPAPVEFPVTPAPVTPAPETAAPSTTNEKLEIGSWWWGYMFFEDYSSTNGNTRDTMEVYGYIGQTRDGKIYFEVYDTKDVQQDTIAYVSYYIDLYDDHFVPVIGNGDAWILDKDLVASEASGLTTYLEDGFLEFTYPYSYRGETCTVYVLLLRDS